MKTTRVTLTTRKPIDELVAADLEAFPIWEFAVDEEDVDGRDETWVRPVDSPTVPEDSWSLSVAAEFQTRSGRAIPGFVAVTTAEGVELGHCILLNDGNYTFVDANSAATRSAIATALGLTEQQTFPITFELRVLIGEEETFRCGAIE